MSEQVAPPPSREFDKLLSALRRHPMAIDEAPLEQLRRVFDNSALPVDDDVSVKAVQIGEWPVEIVSAPGARAERTIVYLHGGGYVMGSPNSHRKLAGDLARASGAQVALVRYPLAPEHPFPAAIEAAASVCEALLDDGVPAHRLAMAGDSAGGGLAIAALILLRDRGRPALVAGVTISAFIDFARTSPYPPELVAADPIVTPETVARTREWYLGSADPSVGLAAVGRADLAGLPPLLVMVGGAEILRDDSRLLATRARDCGVEATLEEWPHMVHVWPAFAGRVPEATAAVEHAGQFIRDAFDASDIDINVS